MIKKLKYRSFYRGCREKDFLLSNFADKILDNLSEEELAEYSKLLDMEDPDIYSWILGKNNPPLEVSNIISKIQYCHIKSHESKKESSI
jgi:antitoxin CptB